MINGPQVTALLPALLTEREERRRLEREHGKGTPQDIGQGIAGVGPAVVWEPRKLLAYGLHQGIKSEFLLTFLVTEWHPAKVHSMSHFLNRELLLALALITTMSKPAINVIKRNRIDGISQSGI